MPVTIRQATIGFKDENGNYIRTNSLVEQTTNDQISSIQQAGASQIAEIENKGAETLESIPDVLNSAVLSYGQVHSGNISSLGNSVTAWPANRIYGIAGGTWKTGRPIIDLPEYSPLNAVLVKECAMIDTDNDAYVYIVYRYVTSMGDMYTAYQMDSTAALTEWSVTAKTTDLGRLTSAIQTNVDDLNSALGELAENGYYSVNPETHYIATEDGQIMSGSNLPVTSPTENGNRGYHWFTAQELSQSIEIDTDNYSYSLAYSNNGTKAGYTTWLEVSPIVFDTTITFTQIGINIKRKDNGALSADEFAETLHYTTADQTVGDLAPKSYVVPAQQAAGDAGKVLTIGGNGAVVPMAMPIDSSLSVSGGAADAKTVGDRIQSLAENGYYTMSATTGDIALTSGLITSSGSITPRAYAGYAWLTYEQTEALITFDATKYKYCLYYELNGSKVAYPGWATTSPVVFDGSLAYDRVAISLQSLTSTEMTEDDLAHALSYEAAGVRKGSLVTEEQLQAFVPRGRKQIYPDGFTSRIRPDIYYNGRFYADIDTDDYRIAGSGEVWVATDGNDSTGDGTEENPYLTITQALTGSATTVHIKEGTYEQGTHYTTSVDFGGKNIVGHGTVILQNDASGHYPSARSSAYFENIIFKHGNATTNTAFNATCTASGQTICFVGCTFRDAGGNGLSVTGIDVVVVNCKAFGNKLDGFNYHDKTVDSVTYVPNVLEIDCVAYNNGTSESGIDSCNGSTAHDGTKIIRLNGEYYSCYGGVIAEIARSGEEPTVSVNYGVLAHDSTGPDTYKASFWVSVNAKMYLYDCQSYGGDYDLSAVNDGMIVSRRLTTGRDVPSIHKATNATVLQY